MSFQELPVHDLSIISLQMEYLQHIFMFINTLFFDIIM